MIATIACGLLAAVVATIPAWLLGRAPDLFLMPILVPGVAAVAMVLQRFVLDRRGGNRNYDGVADLLAHVHSPSSPDTPGRWAARGLISLLLAACGGEAGPEGAAVEFSQAMWLAIRPRSARWFEQRRRTDSASALAAGVSAAFGAPFAAVLLPLELGLGGRALTMATGALVAYAASRLLRGAVGVPLPDFAGSVSGLGLLDARAWVGALVMGVLGGVAGGGLARFFRYAQDSLLDLFQTRSWTRVLCAGVLLFLVTLTYRSAHAPSDWLFEQAVWGRFQPQQAWLQFAAASLSLSMVLAGFGTVGAFWPALAIGGFFGAGLAGWLQPWLGAPVAVLGFAGGAAIWGALLGVPVAGAVLAYELTQNVAILMPCLAAGLIARRVARALRARSLMQGDLEARGLGLIEGRSASVLAAIAVRDAMVTDHEIVHEQEPVAEIYPRLLKSRYPFLPVVNSQNLYTGLLTVDLVQEAWRAQSGHSNAPLSKLLEAKDLLYRAGLKGPTIKVNDRLSAAAGAFETVPCVPVLSDEGRVMGLLFVHNVRLAYDREMARRSLALESGE